jgi:UDP-2,3-diacylglucosamine hydrolase
LSTETLFIADLHLDEQRPAITELFLRFLDGRARGAEALYILGDLFEAWVGDDDDDPHYRTVTSALRRLSQATPVYLMHGNRDFLIGDTFEHASGCQLIPDPTRIELHGTPTLLMHGDTLCTDDHEYMAFRRTVREPAWQQAFLDKPLAERRHIGRSLREQSQASTAAKAEAIMDVNQHAVVRAMREHGVLQLIHGHTHRPAIHELDIDGEPARRIVLGDWYRHGSVLVCSESGCDLQELPVDA